MCSSIINLSEQGLEALDYSYEDATAIILDKNDIRDINRISFITNVQQVRIQIFSLNESIAAFNRE